MCREWVADEKQMWECGVSLLQRLRPTLENASSSPQKTDGLEGCRGYL